jgi:roadblock/LC7 domain-containing protein
MALRLSLIAAFALTTSACAQPGRPSADADLDWRSLEAPVLSDHVQLTSRDDFVKAGEAYFAPDLSRIIFQAVPVPQPGESEAQHYLMYVADLIKDDSGAIIGLGEARLLSAPGSANTCGWFHPSDPDVVLYGSTIAEPNTIEAPGYQRDGGRYKWAFPSEMQIVMQRLTPDGIGEPRTVIDRPGYDAEGSFSGDGRFILYSNVDEERSALIGRPEADIWIYDIEQDQHHALVTAPGYDGGPFFSPDGKRICYRSDRRGDNLLQLYVADLAFDENGVPVAISAEHTITANEHVNWAPFFHPSGDFLVYGTSEQGHWNYEVYAVDVSDREPDSRNPVTPATRRRARVTSSGGADVL